MKHYHKYISEIFGPQEFDQYLSYRDKPLSKSISLVDFQIPKSQIISLLSDNNITLQTPNIYIPNHHKVDYDRQKGGLGNDIWHKVGLYYIQETSASLPATLLNLQKGETVLDMCASPGGKSIQILNELNKLGGGILISNEIDRTRLDTLQENIYKYGFANNITISHNSKYIGQELPNYFDKILVDAPCSGEGTCHRSTKFLDKWSLDLVHKTAKIQSEILENIYHSLKPGGTLIYSTCTLNTIENESVVSEFLSHHDDIKLIDLSYLGLGSGFEVRNINQNDSHKLVRLLPHVHKTGGFFVAKFQKDKTQKDIYNRDILTSKSLKVHAAVSDFTRYIYDKFEITTKDGYLEQNGDYIYYVNGGSEEISQNIYIISQNIFKAKSGIPIAKIHNKGYVLLHSFAKVLGKSAKKGIIKITDINNLNELIQNNGIAINNNIDIILSGIDNQYIYTYQDNEISNIYIGVGKLINNNLKINIK